MKLSVIMPLYNVEKTIRCALDSVLMQKVNFEYEIICVDDKSNDNTLSILKDYQKKHSHIKIIENEKNQGNGYSFRTALAAAQGDYFCVLDGDDYYTVKYKLQKQADFLDSDINNEYTAVVHKYLWLLSNGNIVQDRHILNSKDEYTYYDYITRKFYFHTSTYMYRNIFKEKISPFFIENRGDMPRTFVTQLYTVGKVKVLDFVGSVYNYNEEGIWSHLSPKEQTIKNNLFWERVIDFQPSELEKSITRRNIDDTSHLSDQVQKNIFRTWTVNDCFNLVRQQAYTAAFSQKEFIFQRLFCSELIDSFCETLGRIELNRRGFSPLRPLPDNDNILLNVSYLNKQGGGIYTEIKDIIRTYTDKKVYLLLTDVPNETGLQDGILKDLNEFKDFLTIVFNPEQGENKLSNLFDLITSINPSKTYHYCGHNMVYNNALIQSGLTKNIVVFSIDHGFSLGMDNSSVDCIIAKTPNQYALLHRYFGSRVIYIPIWEKPLPINKAYQPFGNHDKLITATAAARYYKFENSFLPYEEFVARLLNLTNGKHIHYGPIPEEQKRLIIEKLKQKNIPSQNFVHIEWTDNLPQSLLDNNVDIFITPFPVGSAKISIQLEAAGIPLIAFRGDTRISASDYLAPSVLIWTAPDELKQHIQNLTPQKLIEMSSQEQQHFATFNCLETLRPYIRNEHMFSPIPPATYFYDDRIVDIREVDQFFNIPRPIVAEAPASKPKRADRGGYLQKLKYKIWKHLDKKLRKKGIIQ